MKNSKFIDGLTSDLKPVEPISALRNTIVWLSFSLVLIVMMFTMMPVRQFNQMIKSPMFIVSGLWFLVNSSFLAFAANTVGLPGRANQRSILIKSFVIYLSLIGVLLIAAVNIRSPMATEGIECVKGVVMLSIFPIAFFYNFLRKLAPTSPWLAGLLVGLAGSSLGAFGLGFSCSNDDPLHILVFHFVFPAVMLGGLGLIISKKILRW